MTDFEFGTSSIYTMAGGGAPGSFISIESSAPHIGLAGLLISAANTKWESS
jgi:hypothetical protein